MRRSSRVASRMKGHSNEPRNGRKRRNLIKMKKKFNFLCYLRFFFFYSHFLSLMKSFFFLNKIPFISNRFEWEISTPSSDLGRVCKVPWLVNERVFRFVSTEKKELMTIVDQDAPTLGGARAHTREGGFNEAIERSTHEKCNALVAVDTPSSHSWASSTAPG